MYQVHYLEQTTRYLPIGVSLADDQFTTEPMPAVLLKEAPLSEEELHSLFEQALALRGKRVSESLSCDLHTTGENSCVKSVPQTHFSASWKPSHKASGAWPFWLGPTQRTILLVNITLLLRLCGFDLIALLVLALR